MHKIFSAPEQAAPRKRASAKRLAATKPDPATVQFIRNLQEGWAILYPNDKKTLKTLEARLQR